VAGKIVIDTQICKGCQLCATACPVKIISFSSTETNNKGYYPAQVLDMDKCSGCASCARMCPDIAITVERI